MKSSAQFDLFDLAPPPSFRDGPKDQTRNLEIPGSALSSRPGMTAATPNAVHWLVVTTRRAGTACGLIITEYAYPVCAEDEATIRCTHDVYDGTVTCERCLEVRG